MALQGTVLGLGYGAAGTIQGLGERDYHYGATPQALVALRLIFGESANLDFMARSYYVSDVASTENRGSERIFRGGVAFTVRVQGPMPSLSSTRIQIGMRTTPTFLLRIRPWEPQACSTLTFSAGPRA